MAQAASLVWLTSLVCPAALKSLKLTLAVLLPGNICLTYKPHYIHLISSSPHTASLLNPPCAKIREEERGKKQRCLIELQFGC